MDIGIPKIFTKKLVKEDFVKKGVSYFMAYTTFYKLISNFLMRLSEQHTLLNLTMFYHLLNNIISLITVSHSLEAKLIYTTPHRPIYQTPSSVMSCRPALRLQ